MNGRLYLQYTRYGGETTYKNAVWRINEWVYPTHDLARRVERGSFNTLAEAEAQVQSIASDENKHIERILS